MNPNPLQQSLLDFASRTMELGVNWLLQSSLLIAAGLVIGYALRSRGSAVQSAVYRTTLVAALICPLATWVLSLSGATGWSLAMPTAYDVVATGGSPVLETTAEPAVATTDLRPSSFQPPQSLAAPDSILFDARDEMPVSTVESDSIPLEQPLTATSDDLPAIVATGEPPVATVSETEQLRVQHFGVVAVALAVVWIAASLLLLSRLAWAWRRLAELRRNASLAEEATVRECNELATRMSVSTPEVLHSPFLPSPCLAGMRRPAVLLPDGAPDLPVRDVLIHELAHLARNDCHWNLLRRMATALFFFQPLLWKLARRLEATAEEVCDDYVVSFGGNRQDYAHRLVDFAELSIAPMAAAGVGIVSFRTMLARRVTRILDSSRSLSTRVGHALLVLVLLGGLTATMLVGLVGVGPREGAAETETVAESETVDEAVAEEEPEDEDLITVRGQVVDPEGKPVGGADVYALRWFWDFGEPKPLAQVKADDAGRFEISYRKSQFAETAGRPDQWREAAITAFADGFGPGWLTYRDLAPDEESTIRLVIDDVPIEGRIIDLEGNPVAGATIEMGYLNRSPKEDLSEWLEAVRAGQSISTAFKFLGDMLPLFSAGRWQDVTTDTDGRFRLTGIGRERQVYIHVKGPTIATKTLSVVTRAMEPVSQPTSDHPEARDRTNYGARFEYIAAPSRPIEGVVRDAETGEPIAGVGIWSDKFAGENIQGYNNIKVRSDENGRYRLEGMPKGDGNEILVVPSDLPYFTAEFDVPDPLGIEPVQLDIELHRGVWVTGRVTDKVTGKAVAARMHYIVCPDNALAAELPEFVEKTHVVRAQDRYRTDADGQYRVVALPGRGIIGVNSSLDPYPSGQGYDDIPDLADRDSYRKYNGVFAPIEKFPTAVKEVHVHENPEEVICDFVLDPGRRVAVHVLDPSGAPLKDVSVTGARGSHSGSRDMLEAQFEVLALRDDETRTVLLQHKDLGLGKALHVKPADGESGPIALRLQPCATVTGQLVEDGEPVRGARIRFDIWKDGDYGKMLPEIATDADGRFTHKAVLPGLPYAVLAEGQKIEFVTVAKKLEVNPGEAIDLGTIDVTSEDRPEPVRTEAADSTTKTPADSDRETVIQYAGRVVTPDGKPAANAKLFLVYHVNLPDDSLTPTWKPIGTTDAAGNFRIALAAQDLPGNEREWSAASLVASADGFGFAWTSAAMHEASGKYLAKYRERLNEAPPEMRAHLEKTLAQAGQPLRLVRAEPITGRIVDINGQGVAGARLTLLGVWTGAEDDLSPWLEATQAERADYYSARATTPRGMNGPQVRSLVTPAATDADGWFTLRGIGRERIVELLVTGANIQWEKIFARTQAGKPIELLKEWRSPDLGKYTYYPAEFTYVAGPSRPIVGLVRDRETKEPLAGVLIKSQHRHGNPISGWGQDFVRATTGADGRYRLEGMPVGGENRIAAIAGSDQAFLPMSKSADTRAGDSDFEVNFDLPPAVWVNGQVIDKQTGEGLPGWVHYYMYSDNPNLEKIGRPGNVDLRDRYQANDAGRFRIPVLPGGGVIGFTAFDHQKYPRAVGAMSIKGATRADGRDMIKTEPTYLTPSNYHIVAEINPPTNASSVELKLELDSGGSVKGRVLDPDGKPVAGYYYSGRLDKFAVWDMADGEAFEIVGYDAKRPRPIYFAHPERNLAGSFLLESDPPKKLVVNLQLAGKVTGRIVSDEGDPLGNLMLLAWQPRMIAPSPDKEMAEAQAAAPLPPNSRNQTQWVTDDDGRFEIGGLVPGVEYRLKVIDRESMSRRFPPARMPRVDGGLEKTIVVEPGQSLELGDLRVVDDAKFEAAAKSPAAESVISGQVVGPDGKPLAGANVAVIGMRKLVSRGGDFDAYRSEAFGETTSGSDGRYEINVSGLSSKTHQYVAAIAGADGMGVAWKQLNPDDETAEATFELKPEAVIKGRLIDIEGQPVAGAQMSIESVVVTTTDKDIYIPRDGVGFREASQPPAAWVQPVTSDEDGRFAIRGVAEGHGLIIKVEGTDHIAPQDVALNTGMPEQREKRDGTYRPLVKNIKPGKEAVLPLAPAQIFEGVVRYEDTGEPSPHARLTIWASQQDPSGSMIAVAGKADAQGRYKISPNPGIRFGVTAYPPDGSPYLTRKGDPIRWQAGETRKQVDVALPRGVLVRGKVVESSTGTPVANATVQYVPEDAHNPFAKGDILTGWQGIQVANEKGEFEIAILPGPGRLLVHGPQGEFVIRETSSRELNSGKPGGQRNYANAIERLEPEPGAKPINATIELERAAKVVGRLVDGQGQPINEALLISSLNITPTTLQWRGDVTAQVLNGSFELSGLEPEREYEVYFLDPKRRLGASVTLTANLDPPVVVLQPCGEATARFVDAEGEPLPEHRASLHMVVTPGKSRFESNRSDPSELWADSDFVSNIDRANHWSLSADKEGRVVFPALVPGATYRFNKEEFTVASGESLDLGEKKNDAND